ncbi:tRNA lysidine(34) synthetase TilS [Parvibaculum sp.]|uniref:tRNA lysidine(34) synthetase TilS n=1 Tax=Parvibaculum sp. TaxID=2024848 RepID=UPI00320E79F8
MSALRTSSESPVSAAEFAASMAALAPSHGLAVALSGGPDSLALLFLAARWAKRRPRVRLLAFTVDHGLRPESAAEARLAARMAKSLGVDHRILVWKGEKPAAGIQAAARAARYRLLAEAARAEGVEDILVAHHRDDQAETFLLRLARGSGVDGLAAMAPARDMPGAPGIRLLRPLLGFSRARLAATLGKAGLVAIQDPSNENPRFDRVKVRRMLKELEALGLGPERLADTAANMARARSALEAQTRALLASHARLAPEGYVEADAAALLEAPEEISFRALAEILKCVSGADYAPRFDALSALRAALHAALGAGQGARTLHGCKLLLDGGRLLAVREVALAAKAPSLRLKPHESAIWDGRFEITLLALPRGAAQAEWRALGAEGTTILKKEALLPAGTPKAALPGLPALWKAKSLLAVPHIGIGPAGLETRLRLVKSGLFQSP